LLARIEGVLTAAAQVSLAVIALVVVADVVARYAFNSPLTFADGLTERYLIVVVVYFALSSGEAAGVHVRVTVLTRILPPALRRALRTAVLLLSTLYFAGITAFSGFEAETAWKIRQTSTGLIPWPVYVAYTIVPVGTLLMTVRLLLQVARGGDDREDLPTSAEPIAETIE
jgi:TRAP-type C4-dicarboxylate transport system permease small subunit